jgi:hypothetical protein
MTKVKEPKRLCRCGCGKMLSARAERRHRDGQVPPRIAAIQNSQSKVTKHGGRVSQSFEKIITSSTSHHARAASEEQEDASMDESSYRAPSPMDIALDDTGTLLDVERESAELDDAVVNAKAAVLAEWRTERAVVSDDEDASEVQDSSHESSEDELPGLVEDDEVEEDEEEDSQSVDDRVEAEWEKEWAEMGMSLHFAYFATY